MKTPAVLLIATTALFPTYAFQLPFKLPFFSGVGATTQEPLGIPEVPVETAVPNRIAIIGAGAGGSSAAFWISKAKERFGLEVEVDVYEKNDYVGGREYHLRSVMPPPLPYTHHLIPWMHSDAETTRC